MEKRLILIIILCLFLTGCWNSREASDLGVAIAMGIDLIEDDLLEVTVQVLVPRMLESESLEENAVITFNATGSTIFEILRKLTNISSRKIYIGHIQIIVIGETLAKSGIDQMADFFARDHEFRRQALVVLSKDVSAKTVLETRSIFEAIPAMNLVGVIENNVHVGTSRKMNLLQFFAEINSKGHNLVLPSISPRFNETPKIVRDLEAEGLGVFKDGMLVGFLNGQENRGYLWVIGELSGGILVIPAPDDQNKLIAMEILRMNSHMDVKIKNNQLTLIVTVEEYSNIGEQQTNTDLTTEEMIKYLQDKKSELIKNEIQLAFSKAQVEYQSDIFGFGELVRKNHPQIWKEVEDRWDEVFATLPVEINVSTKVERSGQLLKPSKNQ